MGAIPSDSSPLNNIQSTNLLYHISAFLSSKLTYLVYILRIPLYSEYLIFALFQRDRTIISPAEHILTFSDICLEDRAAHICYIRTFNSLLRCKKKDFAVLVAIRFRFTRNIVKQEHNTPLVSLELY